MGSITLSQKRTREAVGGWTNWGTVSTGYPIEGSGYKTHAVYKASVDLTGSSGISSITFYAGLSCTNDLPATVAVYLYNYDPTSNQPSDPPSNYVAWNQLTRTYGQSIGKYGISITGLNLNASTVYIWVTAYYDTGYGWMYSDDRVSQYRSSISATFKAASITLAVSPSSVTTSAAGSKVNLTITNGANYTLYADFYYGNSQTAFKSTRVYNGANQISCPRSWFDTNNVTTLQSMSITVKIRGGNNVASGSFTLNAGSDMYPSVGTPTATIVQGPSAAQEYPNTYIAGISKVKVSAAISRSTNAAYKVNGIVLRFAGGTDVYMTESQQTPGLFEGTTAAPITQDTVFTVIATDVRNLSGQNTVSVTGVVPYTEPSVTILDLYRCDSTGAQENGGEYFKIRVNANYNTALTGNAITVLTAGVKNGTAHDIRAGQSGTAQGPFHDTTDPKRAYLIEIIVQDKVSGEIKREITLGGMLRNIVCKRSRDGTYLAVGATPSRTSGESSIELPEHGSFLVGENEYGAFEQLVSNTENTSFGSDFLNVDMTNPRALKNATAKFFSYNGTVIHGPSAMENILFRGIRKFFFFDADFCFVMLIEIYPQPGRIWTNGYSNGWAGWKSTNPV